MALTIKELNIHINIYYNKLSRLVGWLSPSPLSDLTIFCIHRKETAWRHDILIPLCRCFLVVFFQKKPNHSLSYTHHTFFRTFDKWNTFCDVLLFFIIIFPLCSHSLRFRSLVLLHFCHSECEFTIPRDASCESNDQIKILYIWMWKSINKTAERRNEHWTNTRNICS